MRTARDLDIRMFALVIRRLWWAAALLLITFSISGQAETIRGTIELQTTIFGSQDVYLTVKGQSVAYRIIPTSPSLRADLRKLKTGDLVIGQGTFQNSDTILLDAIETVGLHEILGLWRTADWELFEFKDFHRLNLYKLIKLTAASSQKTELQPVALRSLDYALAPETGSRFSIFMSDSTSVHLGSLEVGDRKLLMTLFDSDTGGIEQKISLSALPLK